MDITGIKCGRCGGGVQRVALWFCLQDKKNGLPTMCVSCLGKDLEEEIKLLQDKLGENGSVSGGK